MIDEIDEVLLKTSTLHVTIFDTFEGADYRMLCFYNFRDCSNKSTRWLCFQKKTSSFQIHKSIYMHSHAWLQLGKGCKFAICVSHST